MSGDCCDDDRLTGPVSTLAVRALAVRGFAALWRGNRPLVAELADAGTVETLRRAGRLEVDDAGRLVGVHGLTMRSTEHRIDHADGSVHTWCALDAIGIPAALGIDATAVTSCPACRAVLQVVVRGGVPIDWGRRRLHVPTGECHHIVDDFCQHANLFCGVHHLRSHVSPRAGRAVTVAEAATMGRTMWHDVARAASDRE